MSSKSSTYLPKDYGLIDLGPVDYLPSLVKNTFEISTGQNYSPLKYSVQAPNSNLENLDDFTKLTLD
jgi:hypothetical protein